MHKEVVARRIVQTFVEAGFTAYFAGGWVRDHLLGIPCSDIDIATNATPVAIQQLFSKTIPVGIAFGSVVVVEEGYSFEVTTFRSESGYADGRHPDEVTFSDPEADAKRRGLTINGMFYDPQKEEVIDLVGGQADLQAGIIRAIGDPYQRFKEDKLRMIRAVRFATRFGFVIEPHTAQAIFAHAHELLPAVAIERIWQEFEKIHAHPDFWQFLIHMHNFGLLCPLFPELKGNVKAQIAPLARYPRETPLVLQLMQLFRARSLDDRLAFCTRFKTSKKEMVFVREQAQIQGLLANREATVTQWAYGYALPNCGLYLQIEACQRDHPNQFLQDNRARQEALAPHIERIRTKQPLVTAAHLRRLGVSPGVQMGRLLRQAERIAIECDLHEAEDVLGLLQFEK